MRHTLGPVSITGTRTITLRFNKMMISVHVCNDSGWHTVTDEVPHGSDQECYRLPKIAGTRPQTTQAASRLEFWRKKFKQEIPDGQMLIWEVV